MKDTAALDIGRKVLEIVKSFYFILDFLQS